MATAKVEAVMPSGPNAVIEGDAADAGVIGVLRDHDGNYEEQLMSLLSRTLASDAVCIDGGANIGVLSLAMARLCPAGRVFCFEPDPSNRRHLEANLDRDGAAVCEVVAAGLTARAGEAQLFTDERHPGGSHLGGHDRGKSHRVLLTSIDRYVEERDMGRVDFIKLDIEGSEIDALVGATETLRRDSPMVVVECNPITLRRFSGRKPDELVEVLRSHYGDVGYLTNSAQVALLRHEDHLHRVLSGQGFIDLVAGDPLGDRLAARRALSRLTRRVARRRIARMEMGRADLGTFFHSGGLRCDVVERRFPALTPGQEVDIEVRVQNATGLVASSTGNHPIRIGARWAPDGTTARGEFRAELPCKLDAGADTFVTIRVVAPIDPGTHRGEISAVQEGYVWLCDIDPDAAAEVELEVTDHTA